MEKKTAQLDAKTDKCLFTSFLVGGDGSSQTHSGGAPASGGDGPGRRVQDVAQQLGLGH